MFGVGTTELDNEQKVKFYKGYLRDFWSSDIKPFDKVRRDILGLLFREAQDKDRRTIGLLARTKNDMCRIGAEYLMSLGRRVDWQWFNLSVLHQRGLSDDDVFQEVREYEYALFLYNGGGNRGFPIFFKNIVASREVERQYTLIISTEFFEEGYELIDPFKQLDGNFEFPVFDPERGKNIRKTYKQGIIKEEKCYVK